MPTLFYADTLNPRKTCATAKHLDVSLEYVRLDLSKGEQKQPRHLALNPNGKVPVLVDGETCLWESSAIMAWLAHAAGSEMWPSDRRRQVEVLRWLSWDASQLYPKAAQFYFQHHIKPRLGLGAPDEALLAAMTPGFHEAARILDTHLAGRRFVVGDDLTIADFGLAATLPYARESQLPIAPYTNIQRWHERLMELPAWRDPWPS